jgi:hypothetical protein
VVLLPLFFLLLYVLCLPVLCLYCCSVGVQYDGHAITAIFAILRLHCLPRASCITAAAAAALAAGRAVTLL